MGCCCCVWLAAAVVPWVVPAGVSRHILGVAVMVEAAVVHVVEVLEPAGSSWHVLVDG